jgi:hypothetical protein
MLFVVFCPPKRKFRSKQASVGPEPLETIYLAAHLAYRIFVFVFYFLCCFVLVCPFKLFIVSPFILTTPQPGSVKVSISALIVVKIHLPFLFSSV